MTKTMRQVLVAGLNDVTVVDSAVPEPGPDEVRVAIMLAGICGSDTHAVAGHHPLLSPPYLPGHELLGVVEKAGPGANGELVGKRAVVKPNIVCEECDNCRAGRSNACPNLGWIGCDSSGALPGGMATYVIAPARNVFALPDDVTDIDAVLVECLATPVHAARIAGDLNGAKVAVLGAGTIGLLSVIAARRAGATHTPADIAEAVAIAAAGGVPGDQIVSARFSLEQAPAAFAAAAANGAGKVVIDPRA